MFLPYTIGKKTQCNMTSKQKATEIEICNHSLGNNFNYISSVVVPLASVELEIKA